MKKFKEEYCVIGFLTVVVCLAAFFVYKQDSKDILKDFLIMCFGVGMFLGIGIGLLNLMVSFIPWKIKIPAKTKTPIYKITEWKYNEQYYIQKFELTYSCIEFTLAYLTVPFLSQFYFHKYKEVYVAEVEVKLHEIGNLEAFVEDMIIQDAHRKAAKEEKLKKRQDPIDKLNREFNQNYFSRNEAI